MVCIREKLTNGKLGWNKNCAIAIVIVVSALFLLTGCSYLEERIEQEEEATVAATQDARFTLSNGQHTDPVTDYEILTDTETGVQYLVVYNLRNSYTTSITVLMNPDGTPISTVE